MGYAAKITSKGQITLPAGLREELDLTPGDSIVFFTDLDGSARFAVRRRRPHRLPEPLAWSGAPLTVRDMDPASPATSPTWTRRDLPRHQRPDPRASRG